MALESIKNINVDFYDDRYILINAKQYDGNSRYITVTCYDQGKIFNLNPSKHTVYVRYRKADGHTVFNFCTITPRGQIEIELTEQMLSASGVCDVDLVVIHKGNAVVNIDTGEIITIDNSAIISTMVFRIYVYESAVDNSLIESSDEYNGLTELLMYATAEYDNVIDASKTWASTSQSWAIGGTGIEGRIGVEDTDNSKYYSQLSRSYAMGDADGIRSGEDVDNSKYYSEQSSISADKAKVSEDNAKESETNAKTSETNASTSESNAKVSETNAKISEDNAFDSANKSQSYAVGGTDTRDNEDTDNAEYYSRLAKSYTMGSSDGSTETRDDEETENAKTYMETTKLYMQATEGYMDETESYMDSAKTSEANALDNANKAQSYAVGGTGVRTGEDTDNAQYYYELIKNIVIGLETGFIPMGTITFSELATAEKAAGYVYNISDDFVTDESFREGEGKSYTAGTNVYFCADGLWDCFGGVSSPNATVDEIKEYLGI